MKHLRFNTYTCPNEHPQVVMKRLGITYYHATPQSMGDQWWFWNCENIPDPLPEYITELVMDPLKAVGHGLSEQEARDIISIMNARESGAVTIESPEMRLVSVGALKTLCRELSLIRGSISFQDLESALDQVREVTMPNHNQPPNDSELLQKQLAIAVKALESIYKAETGCSTYYVTKEALQSIRDMKVGKV